MKNPVPIGFAVGAVVLVLAIAAFLMLRGEASGVAGGSSESWQLNEALTKVQGDVTKLSPEDRKRYEEFVKRNPSGPRFGNLPPEYASQPRGSVPSSPSSGR